MQIVEVEVEEVEVVWREVLAWGIELFCEILVWVRPAGLVC